MASPFHRFERPWLAALAAAGVVWFAASLPLGFVADIHPMVGVLAAALHFLGVATLLVSGVVYALLFWRGYLDEKFFGG